MSHGGLHEGDQYSHTRLSSDRSTGATAYVSGEAGLRTHLVLSGSTAREDINNFPFRPFGIHEGIGDLIELVEAAH